MTATTQPASPARAHKGRFDRAEAHHPATLAVRRQRAASTELRVADGITAFAGSMPFVYIHAVIFAVWCGTGLFGVDKYPFNFLTMTVSLEAIFLSTFVMIGQNRQSEFAQRKAEHDFMQEEQELHLNTDVTRAIHELVCSIHQKVNAADPEALAQLAKFIDPIRNQVTPASAPVPESDDAVPPEPTDSDRP